MHLRNRIGYASVQLCRAGLAGWASAWLGLVCPGLLDSTHHDHNKYHEQRECEVSRDGDILLT